MNIIKIKCAVRITDNGDGSHSATFYNDKEELLKDFRNYYTEDECSDEALMNGDDTYEYGSVTTATIGVDTETGKLVKPFSVSTD